MVTVSVASDWIAKNQKSPSELDHRSGLVYAYPLYLGLVQTITRRSRRIWPSRWASLPHMSLSPRSPAWCVLCPKPIFTAGRCAKPLPPLLFCLRKTSAVGVSRVTFNVLYQSLQNNWEGNMVPY